PLVALHDALQPTLLFRPGLWLILAVAVGAAAWPARSKPAGAFAGMTTAPAGIYRLSFAFPRVAAPFPAAFLGGLCAPSGAAAAALAWQERRVPRTRRSHQSMPKDLRTSESGH